MQGSKRSGGTTRRNVLAAGAALASLAAMGRARAEVNDVDAAIRAFVGEAKIHPGRVNLDVPPLVENGNSVPIAVSVDSPMTAENFVKRIGVFNEKNPQPNVAIFHLGPRAGRASVATRARLANSQKLVAIAELSDGTFWSATADVIVTLAACTEEL